MVKNPPANARDIRDRGSIPGLGRSPGGGNGNPLQDSRLENPMDRGASWAQSMESQRLDMTEQLTYTHTHTHTHVHTHKCLEDKVNLT